MTYIESLHHSLSKARVRKAVEQSERTYAYAIQRDGFKWGTHRKHGKKLW